MSPQARTLFIEELGIHFAVEAAGIVVVEVFDDAGIAAEGVVAFLPKIGLDVASIRGCMCWHMD